MRASKHPDEVSRLGGPAIRAFIRISALWRLTTAQQLVLVGSPARSEYERWRENDTQGVTPEVIERVSHVLAIYKALDALLGPGDQSRVWLAGPNHAPMFSGASPLSRMLQGSVDDLAAVRGYLDAQFERG